MRLKKILAGFLSVMMVFSAVPATAFASEADVPGEPSNVSVPAAGEHEHDFETNEPVLSEDGTKLIYTCAVEGCGRAMRKTTCRILRL